MINYLEFLRLNHLGYSQRTIETTDHCSRHTVVYDLSNCPLKDLLACPEIDQYTVHID